MDYSCVGNTRFHEDWMDAFAVYHWQDTIQHL